MSRNWIHTLEMEFLGQMTQTNVRFMLCLLLVVFNKSALVSGQSRCSTACQNNPSCLSGVCTLASCTDTTSCYQFCLNCSGVVTCYGSGSGCSFSASLVQVTSDSPSNKLRYHLIWLTSTVSLIKYWK